MLGATHNSQKSRLPLCNMERNTGQWGTLQVDGAQHSTVPMKWCSTSFHKRRWTDSCCRRMGLLPRPTLYKSVIIRRGSVCTFSFGMHCKSRFCTSRVPSHPTINSLSAIFSKPCLVCMHGQGFYNIIFNF